MPATLSLLENVRECLKDLYILTTHLLGNGNSFCSIICEMHLIDVPNFLRSRISLTPPAPGRLRNTWSTSHFEWPHVIWAKRCLRTAIPGAAPMQLAFYNRTALWKVFGTQLPEASPSQEKVLRFALQIKCTLQISMQSFSALAITETGHSKSSLFFHSFLFVLQFTG